MKLAHKRHNVGNVLDYVAANDLIEFVIAEGIRQNAQVVNHVGVRPWV
jgi:urease gamma subunit